MKTKKKKVKRLMKRAKKRKTEVAFDRVIKELGMEVDCQLNIDDIDSSGVGDSELIKEKIESLCNGCGIEKLTFKDEISFSCNRAGRCCFGRNVPLSPVDVWNIIKNKNIQGMGYRSTDSLFCSINPYGFMHWGINDFIPFGVLVFHKLLPDDPNSITKCPMALPNVTVKDKEDYIKLMREMRSDGVPAHEMFWRHNSGVPMFYCALGDDRPTVCKSYPIGRVGLLEDEKDYKKWRFMIDRRQCLKCFPESFLCEPRTVEDYIKDTGLVDRYSDVIEWNMFCAWIKNQNLTERQVYMAGSLAFNFDSPLLKSGLRPNELEGYRPKSFSDMLNRIKAIIIQENEIAKNRRIVLPNEI